MHDEAILTRGTGRIASTGSSVTIDAVEKIYTSSAAVKAAEFFVCADPKCGVTVIAVITQSTKPGRKKSPSSYFRASPNPHRRGCTRRPSAVTTASPPLIGSKPAKPTKGTVPTKWKPPTASPGPSTAGTGTPPSTSATAGTGIGTGTSATGTGTSSSSSSRVKHFAKSWKTMAPATLASTELSAPWNAGETYASAFMDLAVNVLASAAQSPIKIYRGTIARIHHGTTGYSLTLSQAHSTGKDLLVWVQNGVPSSCPSGAELWSRLTSGAVAVGTEVFALGQFDHNSRPHRVWYSLPVADGHDIWIP